MSITEEATKVHDLITDTKLAMLTSVDHAEGRIVSRPMAVQEVDDAGAIWFFTSDEAPKAEQLARDPSVNVAFTTKTSWVSLAGQAEIVEDQEKIRALWNAGAEAWFPEGPDAKDVALLKVTPESAEYWDVPGTRVAATIAYAKALVTGDRPDVGENGQVEL